jgi:glycosyltransferase involved in cell wall biosynthesis
MTLTLSEITVVILTLNEEANLQRCLDSTGWAADRVVIDSGSTDATLEIASKNKVRYLVRQAKPFLISEQRNWALENAAIKTEWTLFIDADEVIPERLRQELQQVLATAPAYVTGYRLTPQFMFLGRWLRYCQGYPNWHDRLVRTGRGSYSAMPPPKPKMSWRLSVSTNAAARPGEKENCATWRRESGRCGPSSVLPSCIYSGAASWMACPVSFIL